MKRPERRERVRKSPRKDYLAIAGVAAFIANLLFRIPLGYFIGDKGMGYFSVANELYILLSCVFSYGLSTAVSTLVRYRIKREQYKNVARVLKSGILLSVIIGVVFSLLLLVGGFYFTEAVFQIKLSGMAVCLMAPALVFSLMAGVLKGYFQGNGSRVPALHSKILEQLFMITGGLIGALLLYRYGMKAAALLQNQDYAGAYGAMGAVIGILASAVLCFLHLLMLYLLYRNAVKNQILRDTQKNQEGKMHPLGILCTAAVPYFLIGLFYNSQPLIDQYLFQRYAKEGTDPVTLWGSYYGKYMVVLGLITSFICLLLVEPVRKITIAWEKDEKRIARERLSGVIHQCAVITIPSAIFTAVLAENVLNVFFKGNNAKTAAWLQWGSVLIVFFAFSFLVINILLKIRKNGYVIILGAIALTVHAACVILLMSRTLLEMEAVIISNILFNLIIVIAGFFIINKVLQYKQEWIRSFGITSVAAAVTGLIMMLLNKALAPLMGPELSLLVCLPVGIIIYVLLLLVTRGLNEHDLEKMSGGGILIRLAKMIHLM